MKKRFFARKYWKLRKCWISQVSIININMPATRNALTYKHQKGVSWHIHFGIIFNWYRSDQRNNFCIGKLPRKHRQGSVISWYFSGNFSKIFSPVFLVEHLGRTASHCEKYSNFSWFHGVEILWKCTVSA